MCSFSKPTKLWSCKEESLPSTDILCNAHEFSNDFNDAVDVLKSTIHPSGTEWDLVFVDYKVSISELLTYVWICALKGCHSGKVKRNQPGILLFRLNICQKYFRKHNVTFWHSRL